MDNKQLFALVSEYMEGVTAKYDGIEIMPERTMAAVIRPFMRWICDRFCLVEKSKVEKEYKSAKHDSKMAHRERLYTMLAVAGARKALLESLFPEIGKEVENG